MRFGPHTRGHPNGVLWASLHASNNFSESEEDRPCAMLIPDSEFGGEPKSSKYSGGALTIFMSALK